MNYNNEEWADIHYCYGAARGNTYEAQRIYAELFPLRNLPCPRTFQRVHDRLRATGNVNPQRTDVGRPRTRRTVRLEEEVLERVENNPRISTRQMSDELQVDHVTIWRILNTDLLYPYHLQRVQGLLERDFEPRVQYCQWLLRKIDEDRSFLKRILFTDESTFSRDGIINLHNNHIWAHENPHELVEGKHQYSFKLNVWGGIVGDFILGPVFLPPTLNGENYLEFLVEELPGLLQNVPLADRYRLWFMHDGCPAHYRLIVREHLNTEFPQRWIGRAGPVPWAARSPDHNPIDFYMWGDVKSLVYDTPVPSVEVLRERIIQAFGTIRNRPRITARVRHSVKRRAEACIEAGGSHFEHLL